VARETSGRLPRLPPRAVSPESLMSFPFPVATGKKKTVQVFECPQETWKQRKPTARKVSDMHMARDVGWLDVGLTRGL
jgi:hypothetical protein